MPEIVSFLDTSVTRFYIGAIFACWSHQFFSQGKQPRTYLLSKAADSPKLNAAMHLSAWKAQAIGNDQMGKCH